MKTMKKVLALLMVLAMVMAILPAAFAENDGSITLTAPVAKDADGDYSNYSAYRIFDLSYSEAGTTKAYVYTVNEKWTSFSAPSYFEVNDNVVTWKGENTAAAAAAFAKLALGYAKNNSITADVTLTNPTLSDNKLTYTANNLPLGYYLIDSKVGTLLTLNSTDKNATVEDKNDVPSIDKVVQENSLTGATNQGWGHVNDAKIGETINFKTTVAVKTGAHKYIVHDKMVSQLDLIAVGNVVLDETTLIADTDYIVKTGNATGDGCSFHVEFVDAALAGKDGKDVVINYTAKLNDTAQVEVGYDNETWLNYGDTPFVTNKVITKSYTWKVDLFKYYLNGAEQTPLAGATFELQDLSGTPIKMIVVEENEIYRIPDADETGTTARFVTTATGAVTINGLDAGKYKFVEVEAPEGYNKAQDVEFELKHTDEKPYEGTTLSNASKTGDYKVEIENKTGAVLPTTGGVGTTMFYVGGAVLVLFAVVMLVSKKRMGAAE